MERRAYDNWGRLVEAVVRKQQLWEMFHAPSRTPSMSSTDSDTNYASTSLGYSPNLSIIVESDEKFESRKLLEEEILAALLHEDVSKLGIFGSGGIGKTTMVKRVGELVRKAKTFDEVLMIVIGWKPDIERIQSDISEALGLRIEENDLEVRASLLNSTMKGLRNILVILDDVWVSLALEEIGIPIGCKIMFVSENEDVLEAMQAERVFQVQGLSNDEAWTLFKGILGNKINDLDLQLVATMVANECHGVPLALNILGSALKEKDKLFWEDALDFLRSVSSEITNGCNNIYASLKLSYTWLTDEAKSLFMFCCLFRQDSDIFLEELTRLMLGLGMFDGITSLEEARSRVQVLTALLKDHYLLEDGCDEENVKVHNVVQSMAIFIVTGRNDAIATHNLGLTAYPDQTCDEKYAYISVSSMLCVELPKGSVCPSIHSLRWQDNLSEGEPLETPHCFTEGTKKFKVLMISSIYMEALSLPSSRIHKEVLLSLPSSRIHKEVLLSSLSSLTQLKTLYLHSCSVKSVSEVGLLEYLEILSIYDCHRIEVLSTEIRRLSRLRLLELYQCKNLKMIAAGVISRLFSLEELKIHDSFAQWQSEGGERTIAAISELQSLSNLVDLEIEVEDPKAISAHLYSFPKVKRFCIKLGIEEKRSLEVRLPYKRRDRQSMHLCLHDESSSVGNWVLGLLTRTEDLSLTGNGPFEVVFEEVKQVKKIRCCHCSTISHLLNQSNRDVFRFLESLILEDLPNLHHLCNESLPDESFTSLTELKLYQMPVLSHLWKNPNQNLLLMNLTSVDIRYCNVLPYLLDLSVAMSLVHLEELRILFCGNMKEVMSNDLNNASHAIEFSKLKKLILHSLQSLVAFTRGVKAMRLPQLHFLSIRNLPKLQGLLRDGSPQIFFNQKVEFNSLKELSLHGLSDSISQIWSLRVPNIYFNQLEKLHICACNKVKYLLSPSMAEPLVLLKELSIKDSVMMTEVVINIENETPAALFPSLERLELWRLRSLKSFYQWRHDLELPCLRHVCISQCPEMQNFTVGSLSTPNLERFEVDSGCIEIKDLNRYFRAKGKKRGE